MAVLKANGELKLFPELHNLFQILCVGLKFAKNFGTKVSLKHGMKTHPSKTKIYRTIPESQRLIAQRHQKNVPLAY